MIIYLDMDGVLTNFIRGAEERFGIVYDPNKELIDQICECFGITVETVYRHMNADWWANLEPTRYAKEILSRCLKHGSTRICTTLPPYYSEAAYEGKRRWLKEMDCDLPIITTSEKHLLANPNALLIDDCGVNVQMFRSWGGEAYRVTEHTIPSDIWQW